MNVEPFNISKHLSILSNWLVVRDQKPPKVDEIPVVGWICYVGNKPVSTAFIRNVEGGIGLIDGLATNPECSSEVRNMALNFIIDHLMAEAKKLKFHRLMCFSVVSNVISRAKQYHFEELPHTVLSCTIKE